MLLRLIPDQISRFWGVIKFAVEQSLPPTVGEHPDKINRILSSALSGGIDVWASYSKIKNEIKFESIVLTKFLFDDTSETKSLLVYCIYSYTRMAKDNWLQGLQKFAKYAKSRGCNRIVAYTNNNQIIELFKHCDGDIDYTFISLEIDKIV